MEVQATKNATPAALDSTLPLASTDTPVQESGSEVDTDTLKSDKQALFTDLLLDVFLVEKATHMRSRVDGSNSKADSGHVTIQIQELAQAFANAQETCRTYLEKYSAQGLTNLLLETLVNSKLDNEDKVLKLVRGSGGCQKAFRAALNPSLGHGDHHQPQRQEQQQHQNAVSLDKEQTTDAEEIIGNQPVTTFQKENPVKAIRLPQEDSMLISEGYQIPVVDSNGIKRFEAVYGEAPAGYQDPIARIVRYWRRDLWKHVVLPLETDKFDREIIFKYGSRYFHMTNESQRKKREKELLRHGGLTGETSSADPENPNSASGGRKGAFPEYLTRLLQGLSISEAHSVDTYGLQGKLALPLVKSVPGAFEKTSVAMTLLYQKLVPSPSYMAKRETLIRKIQNMLNSTFPHMNLKIEVFGSYASGLGSESSDADLCITSENFQKHGPYTNMRTLANMLRRGGMARIQPISNARVPIVKFIDPYLKISCDINSGHVLGIHNSELIRCYTLIDDRVRPFLYSLKAIVKKQHINDSSQSFLSSYAYVMMAIGFLQAQDPPVLPSLQAQPLEQMTILRIQMNHEGRNGKDLIDCSFDREISRYENFGRANTKSVGQLLTEFFQFYSRQFDYQTMEVNVRLGGGFRVRDDVKKQLSKGRAPQVGRGERKLVVMDPFIRDRNVAGSCQGRHLLQVWLIFEALYLIMSRGEFSKALEPILVRDVAQYDLKDVLKATVEGAESRQQRQQHKQQQETQSDPSASMVKAGRHRGRDRKERETEQEKESEMEPEQEKQARKEKEERQQTKEQRKSKQKESDPAKEQKPQKQKLENERKKAAQQPGSSASIQMLNSAAEVTIDPAQPKALPAATAKVGNVAQSTSTIAESEGEADGDTNDDADADQDNGQASGESKSRKRRVRKAIARGYHNSTLNESAISVDTSAPASAPTTLPPVATDSGSKNRIAKVAGSRPVTPVPPTAHAAEKDHLEESRSANRRQKDESKRLSSGSEAGSVGNHVNNNRKTVALAQSATSAAASTTAVISGEEPARPKIKVMQTELIKTLGEQKRHNDQLNNLIQVNQVNQSNERRDASVAVNGANPKESLATPASTIAHETATALAAAAAAAANAAAATRSLSQTVSSTPSATALVSTTGQQGQKKPLLGKTHKLLLNKLGGGRGKGVPRNNNNGNNKVVAIPAGHEADARWNSVASGTLGQGLKQQPASLQLKQHPSSNSTVPSSLKTNSVHPLKHTPSQATTVARGPNAIV
ncbi:hypothetical protein EMPS_04413 [Entomortierella parvispora]|uniref:polynucleotide adenylyltransferase n=1 Tax=Entomortierella parvispora TaxID=205924 RepID=A0A9P3LVD5_9FUNG|nr:hypothetical protein EMPS_04413 [Entomortierella parvispora]